MKMKPHDHPQPTEDLACVYREGAMNYYSHHIGDYRRDTAHLTLIEHGVYRQMLDQYYLDERPICADDAKLMRSLCARTADEMQAVKNVLADFFVLTESGYMHKRCDVEIEAFHGKSKSASESAKARWERVRAGKPAKSCEVNANALPPHTEGNANHKPLTINHKPIDQKTSAAAPDDTVSENQEVIIAEPKAPASPPAYSLPLNTNVEFPIDMLRVEEFSLLYPAVDVMQELRKMRGWLIGNPTKRKTKSGMMKFVNAWLSKQQDDAGSRPGQVRTVAGGRPSINNIGVAPGADDDIFNQMRTEFA